MELFVRLQETLASKGSVIPLTEYQDSIKLKSTLKTSPGSDWYTSLFYYPKDIKELFETKGSVAGYKGPSYSKSLVWDFDSKEDLNLAKNDVRVLLSTLKKLSGGKALDSLKVYFSGNKGFHVFLKTNKEFTPNEMAAVCSKLAEGLGTFDQVIYNSTRLLRIVNTKHQLSGLYKIAVSPHVLKEPTFVDDIKKLAKAPSDWVDNSVPLEDTSFIEEILAAKPEKKALVLDDVEEIGGIRGLSSIDLRKAIKTPKCIYALSQGIMVPGRGERNHIYLHLGNFYRNQGLNKELTHNILKGIARSNKLLYPESEELSKQEIWNTIITRVFGNDNNLNPGGWGIKQDDLIFARYCKALDSDCKCPIHDAKNAEKKAVIKIEEVAASFGSFATNFVDNIVTTGIKFIDTNMKIATGTASLLIGAAGSGKTTLCLNMLEHTNKEKQNSLFFSLDMHKNLLYLKLAQRHTRHKQADIFQAFKNNDRKMISHINDTIKDNYSQTYFDFSGSISIEDMKHRILTLEQETSTKVKLVIVDYASRLTGPHSDSNANEKFNALRSKDVADETAAAWVILNQVARSTGDGSSPIRTKRAAKGSGDWEEAASNVVTVWRPFMGLNEQFDSENQVTYYDSYMNIFLAKNRIGQELEDVMLWDGEGGLVRDMNDAERDRWETEEKKKIKMARQYRSEGKN